MYKDKSGYVAGIDGLRAIAVLAVILYHIDLFDFLPGGFSGVDVFFVISGYVISKSLAGNGAETFLSYLAGFYNRRLRRILPALLVCLLATVFVSALFIPSVWLSRTNEGTGLIAFFGLSNFVLAADGNGYFSAGVNYNPFLHTWSLAVEEQFYVLFPALFFIWLKFKDNADVIGWAARLLLPVLALMSLGFAWYETGANQTNAFYLLPSRFWELAAGALLFQLQADGKFVPQARMVKEGLLLAGAVLMLAGFAFVSRAQFPFPAALLPVAGTVLMIAGAVGQSGQPALVQRILAFGPLAYIGKISYSLYLWHWPVAVLARWTLGFDSYAVLALYLPLVFGLAALSYHFIETPIRSGAFVRVQKNWRVVVAGLASVFVFWFAAGQIYQIKPSIDLSVTRDEETWRSIGWVWPRDLSELVGTADLSGRKLFSFGDSHSAAYRTMLKEVSGNLGIEVIEYEEGDCPYPSLLNPLEDYEHCTSYFEDAIADIKANANRGDFVLLAGLRVPELADPDLDWMIKNAREQIAPERIETALDEGIEAFKALDMDGVHFIIDAPAPVMAAPAYRCSDWFNKMNPICANGMSMDRDLLIQLRQPVVASMKTLASRFDNLTVWDPFPILCPGETCSAYDEDGQPLFWDGDHLSGNGNRALTPSFIKTLIGLSKT